MAPETLQLSVPAEAGAVRVIRAVVGGVAAGASFAFDTFDDLHLAIDEASGELIAHGATGQLDCTVTSRAGAVDVIVTSDRPIEGWPQVDWAESLGAVVLQAIADEVRYESLEGRPSIAFSMQAG